jgi:dienelactone hydrolase
MRTALLALLLSAPALAALVKKPLTYAVGDTQMESVLLYDDAVKAKRPGLVLVPNWLGINEANLKQAAALAGQKYVVLVADMYGTKGRPADMEAAGKAAGAVKGDRALMRARASKALEVLLAQAATAPLDAKKVGAIGFCFGGTSALELARSGAALAGVVSFHGGLDTPKPEDAKNIKGRVLVLHGADDPNVPEKDVTAFEAEMRAAKVDWQLVKFGNAVHSFTDPDAKTPGRSEYNPKVAKRAFQMMNTFFAETFAP